MTDGNPNKWNLLAITKLDTFCKTFKYYYEGLQVYHTYTVLYIPNSSDQ